jgi:hypothetical protein
MKYKLVFFLLIALTFTSKTHASSNRVNFTYKTIVAQNCASKDSLQNNSFLQEYYEKGVAKEVNGTLKFDIPFDLHGYDCGAPDCYQTDLTFEFKLQNPLKFPTKLPFQIHEQGCTDERQFDAVFTLSSEDKNCVIYHCVDRSIALVLFSNDKNGGDYVFLFEGVEPHLVTNKTITKMLKAAENEEFTQPYMCRAMRSYE